MNLKQIEELAKEYQEKGFELAEAVKMAVEEVKRNEDLKHGIYRTTLF